MPKSTPTVGTLPSDEMKKPDLTSSKLHYHLPLLL